MASPLENSDADNGQRTVLVPSAEEIIQFPAISVPQGSFQIFEDVTAKVPMFMLQNLSMAEQLPFLLKLAENLTVNILMGMEMDPREVQTFSYQGTLQNIIEIQKRIHKHLGVSSSDLHQEIETPEKDKPEMKSIGVGTETIDFDDKETMCTLLEEPQYTRSGRMVKKTATVSYLYEEFEPTVITPTVKTTFVDKEKPPDNDWQTNTMAGNTKHKHGRKRKFGKISSSKDIDVNETDKVEGTSATNKNNTDISGVNSDTEENDDHLIETENENVTSEVANKDEQPSKVLYLSYSAVKNDKTHTNTNIEKTDVTIVKRDSIDLEITERNSDGSTYTLPISSLDIKEIESTIAKTSNMVERQRLQKLYYELKTPWRFKCDLCSFKTKRESHFKKHVSLHKTKNPKIHCCALCDYKTIRVAKMTEHADDHKNGAEIDRPKSTVTPQKLHICSQCGKVAGKRKKDLLEHWSKKHGITDPDSFNVFQCKFCEYATNMQQRLRRHMACHESMDDPRTYTNKFSCTHSSCSYTTTKKNLLKAHVNDKHSTLPQKKFLCDVCGTNFKRKHGLMMHRKYVHSKGSAPLPFQCSFCGKKHRSLAHQKEHELSHTNKRAFLCETCGGAFKTKSSVKRHKLTVHNEIKRYICHLCNKKFTTHTSLLRHEKTSNGKCAQDRISTWQPSALQTPKVETQVINPVPGQETQLMIPVSGQENLTNSQLFDTKPIFFQNGETVIQILQALPTTHVFQDGRQVTLSATQNVNSEASNMELQNIVIEPEEELVTDGTEHFSGLNESHNNGVVSQVVVLDSGLHGDITGDSVVMGTVPVAMETETAQATQVLSAEGEVVWEVENVLK